MRETEKEEEEEEEEGERALKEEKEGEKKEEEMELSAADTVLDTKDCLAVHIVSTIVQSFFVVLMLVCINLEN